MRRMTAGEILERGAYANENDEQRNEILEWLTGIADHCNLDAGPRVCVT